MCTTLRLICLQTVYLYDWTVYKWHRLDWKQPPESMQKKIFVTKRDSYDYIYSRFQQMFMSLKNVKLLQIAFLHILFPIHVAVTVTLSAWSMAAWRSIGFSRDSNWGRRTTRFGAYSQMCSMILIYVLIEIKYIEKTIYFCWRHVYTLHRTFWQLLQPIYIYQCSTTFAITNAMHIPYCNFSLGRKIRKQRQSMSNLLCLECQLACTCLYPTEHVYHCQCQHPWTLRTFPETGRRNVRGCSVGGWLGGMRGTDSDAYASDECPLRWAGTAEIQLFLMVSVHNLILRLVAARNP